MARRVCSLAAGALAITAQAEAPGTATVGATPEPARFPLPLMGFNPCNSLGCDMKQLGEATLLSVADSIANNGMLAAGYEFFNLDDGWQAGARSADGGITADPSGFPSGMGAFAAQIRARGLKFGLYTDRGVTTCEGAPGSFGHEAQDAATYASWGVAWVKSDSCRPPSCHRLRSRGAPRTVRRWRGCRPRCTRCT